MPKPVMITVDDDPDVLRSIERDLRQHYAERYKVLRAGSAAEALGALGQLVKRNEQVALFLADQRMPVTTGVEFLGQFLNTLLDERLPLFCDDQGVFILGLEVVRLLHGYETDAIFILCFNPTQEISSPFGW